MNKKGQKAQRRQRKVREKKQFQDQKDLRAKERLRASRQLTQYRREYPTFYFRHEDRAPAAFVAAVRQAVNKIDFNNKDMFTDTERELYRELKSDSKSVFQVMNAHDRKTSGLGTAIFSDYIADLGRRIYKSIGLATLKQWIPFNDVMIVPSGSRLRVNFDSLLSTKGQRGTIYHSRKAPTVLIAGQTYKVGWSRHAIEQTCDRLCVAWDSYDGMGDAFAFFANCRRFDGYILPSGERAFTFYNSCRRHYWSERYVTEVFGEEMDNSWNYYFRIGYCPVADEDNGFVKAITLLCPGYRQTPEHAAIIAAPLPRSQRRAMLLTAEQVSARNLLAGDNVNIIKWFHNNGIMQVFKTKEDLYDHS